ncbi:hypothetical protein A3D78_04880 [Candidatus Gottesmanbacteria bacterium RIFCSPHIGHO2_02_FULL_39_14]|uniref:Type II secretion system protein GspF domain-containing protein n=1 Tax=Candidatus Gottesmanbacteria bacterium RIFCSPHIGHO2_02_FULL_39_14 TaxID=1798383 RepID=A0A1F5ZTJ7_9BACT|nr:MAG: hypothetical protein A3D78_04880 [Candidatus Gottesmanbacteria bacterium RIFCSPHIGHO2_02_FULL_39_14]
MAKFKYKARRSDSRPAEGFVEADNLKQAQSLLHERGYFIISLKEQASNIFSNQFIPQGISFPEMVHVTRQLSTMITAGLNIDEALLILIQQVKKARLINLLKKIEEEVRSGKSLTSALEKYPRIFSPVYLALVRAGEASGKLDLVLERLADNLEKSRDFRNKIKGALVYPTLIVSGMVVVTFIVMTVVVPRLTGLYKEFDIELPLPTRLLIGTSDFFVANWYYILIFAIVFFLLLLKIRQSKYGQFIIATFMMNIPIFGPIFKQSTLVEITKTLAILIESGVPILSALAIARNATNNIIFKDAFDLAAKKVEKGFPLSDPLLENKMMPSILGQMVAIGEHTGKLGESLTKLSRYFETEADIAVRTLTTLIEPLIMVILGVGVGFLVLAVLLPIYSLTSKF